jgi:drug/metabolite transporter (DMT)-like permease
MPANHLAYLYTLLTILLWSGSASAFKLALQQLAPSALLWTSGLISLLVMMLLLGLQGRLTRLGRIARRDWPALLLLGLLNPFLYYVVLFEAYDRLPAQIAMSLNYLWPVMLALLSVPILGQRLGWSGLLPILLSFAGAVLIATRGEPGGWREIDLAGLLLALASTLIWAGYWLYSTRLRHVEPAIKLFVAFLVGTPLAVAYSAFDGTLAWPGSGYPWWPVLYVGLFEMGLTFFIWQQALSLARSAASIGNLIYLTPFLSLLILSMLLGERILPATLWGLLLIIAGILLQQYAVRRATNGHKPA